MKKASYKRLWKLLIDKDMNRKTLAETAGISISTLAKLNRCETVNVEILIKICSVLDCTMNDIMELIPIAVEQEDTRNDGKAGRNEHGCGAD